MGTLIKIKQIYLMNKVERILIVDDDEFIRLSLKMLLEQHYKNIEVLADPKRIETLLQRQSVDVVLLDMNYRKVPAWRNRWRARP